MMTYASAQNASLEQLTDELAAAGWDSTQTTRREALAAVIAMLSETGGIRKSQVDLCQGQDEQDRDFGYVAGDEGGYFFAWMPTLDETLDSIEVDAVDGSGDLDVDDVRSFLADYLPGTDRGQKMW